MKFCSNCGQRIKGAENFCPNCGSSVNYPEPADASIEESIICDQVSAETDTIESENCGYDYSASDNNKAEEVLSSEEAISCDETQGFEENEADGESESFEERESCEVPEAAEEPETYGDPETYGEHETVEEPEAVEEAETYEESETYEKPQNYEEPEAYTEETDSQADKVVQFSDFVGRNADTDQEEECSDDIEEHHRLQAVSENHRVTEKLGGSFVFGAAAVFITLSILIRLYMGTASFFGLPGGYENASLANTLATINIIMSDFTYVQIPLNPLIVYVIQLCALIPILMFTIGLYVLIGTSDRIPMGSAGFRLCRFDLILKFFLSLIVTLNFAFLLTVIILSLTGLDISADILGSLGISLGALIIATIAVLFIISLLLTIFYGKAAKNFRIAKKISVDEIVPRKFLSDYPTVICFSFATFLVYNLIRFIMSAYITIPTILIVVEYINRILFYVFMGITNEKYKAHLIYKLR